MNTPTTMTDPFPGARSARARTRPGRVLAAAALLGGGLLLTACGVTDLASPAKEETSAYDVDTKVPVLRVDAGAGDIRVTESDRAAFHVTEKLYWRNDKPVTEHPVQGDTLHLGYTCPRSGWSCGVDYTIEVPRGVRVSVKTGSGDVTLREVSGGLDVEAGSGTIDARGLSGGQAVARTGSGDVELRFTGTPDKVEVRTGSGTGVVHVPDGAYAVTAETGSGERKIAVTDDDSSPRTIVVRSGSGDAQVLPS
ncbi:lipoprotein [Sphaerisporangium melleum]|uniref:Lipoprotein n=1 Tax=Sphaerisporangium melleum TaxID=321316 RepID=A0A917R1R8_9ACTN|nr:DUF4097 family beta strand repeat-containing protein [Sphaerisporangium melleum]GGK82585.1 lipoprotein [Sphaerisporangium melleum]GII69183.1 lipoprotein [Sphaerisporangium melleum]